MIDLVRQLMASVAREDSVDYVEVTLRDGPPRAELDAALGTPEALPRMPGPAFERFGYPGTDGVTVFADVDDETGRVLAVLVRRDSR